MSRLKTYYRKTIEIPSRLQKYYRKTVEILSPNRNRFCEDVYCDGPVCFVGDNLRARTVFGNWLFSTV